MRHQEQSYLQHSMRGIALTTAFAMAIALAGCSADGAIDETGASDLTSVSFALDWAPNTNHIGVYVADELGYFEEAGINVDILPYGSTAATQLVSAREADFGIGGQATTQMGRATGLDIVSVFSITQTDAGRLVVLGDREDLTRPADLDGLTFGGFGSPLYAALAAATIEGDGGAGKFEEVVLDTGAYEALSQGRIDFTLSVATWENIQTELDGHPYREFRYQDFGVPQQQSTGIVSSEAFLSEHPDLADAFVQAVARGYAYAVAQPAEAAELLVGANPDTLGTAEELVQRSAKMLANDGYFEVEERATGEPDPEAWNEFGAFLFEGGFLIGPDGDALDEEPDWNTFYTDEHLG